MKTEIIFITLVSGDRYTRFLIPHIFSVLSHHSSAKFVIYYNDINESCINSLIIAFPEVTFINLEIVKTKNIVDRISGKFNYIVHACQNNPLGSKIVFLDADTLVLKPLDDFFNDDYDILFTWKNERLSLNTGVMLFNNTKATRTALGYMNRHISEILKNPEKLEVVLKHHQDAPDQYVLNEILGTKDYNQNIVRELDGEKVVFKPVHCKLLNETRSIPITNDTHIIHYKSGWHKILLDGLDFHENRPREACWEMYQYWLTISSIAQHYKTKQFIINSCHATKNNFKNCLPVYEERGMLNSELLAFCAASQYLKIDLIVESGRCRGQSTYAIANFFKEKEVDFVSIELSRDKDAIFAEKRLEKFKKLKLLYGDSIDLFENNKIKELTPAKNVAILLDGPKGEIAVNLAKKLFKKYSNIRLIAIHDTRKQQHQRFLLEDHFEKVFFTDDSDFINQFKAIDINCKTKDKINFNSWRPYYKGFIPTKSYGPTLALILRPDEKAVKSLQTKIISILKRIASKVKRIVTNS